MIAYHSTLKVNTQAILSQGLQYSKSQEIWPNDLGYGIYTYTNPNDEEKGIFEHDAMTTSRLFVLNNKENVTDQDIDSLQVILKEKIYLLNLTNPDIKRKFQILRNNLKHLFFTPEILAKYVESDSKKRGQTDGLFYEYIFGHEEYDLDPDAVISDTVAKISPNYWKTNFPNGRELSIRHNTIILDTKVLSLTKEE